MIPTSDPVPAGMRAAASGVDLYWLPLGAGRHVVAVCGRIYEALVARMTGRAPRDLYHAALEVRLDGVRYVIEMAPVWDRAEPDRGVVRTGPVGIRWLGRSRWFRYEVRCWRDGVIPDLAWAVGGAGALTSDRERVAALLDLLHEVPAATWGRDEHGTGEMWNSNSMVSWALARSGHDLREVPLPPGGRAPGWGAGVVVARRQGAGRPVAAPAPLP